MNTAPKSPTPEDRPGSGGRPEARADEPKAERRGKGGRASDGTDRDGPEAKGPEGKGKGKSKGGPGAAPKKGKPIPDNPDFRYIVRIVGSDLDGRRPAALALTGVRGIGLRMASVACRLANVNPTEMIGNLPEATVEGIESAIGSFADHLPPWMLNHPKDTATGEVHHFASGDLETTRRDDINRMKMIRSYRGVRHERGQKVRGQRTRSNGRTGMAAGVIKKAAKEAAAAKGREEGAAAPSAPASPAAPAAAVPGAKSAPAPAPPGGKPAPAAKPSGGAKGSEKKS